MPAIASPFAQFFDTDGTPLNDGRLYFGVVGTNPAIQANQIPIFWDAEMTQPAAQPVLTQGGYIYRAGTPATIFCNSRFSMSIYDKNQKLIAYARDAQVSGVFDLSESLSGPDGANLVGFGSTTVGDQLGSLVDDMEEAQSQIAAQAVATGIGTDGVSTGTVQSVLDSVTRATRFRSAMELNQRDVYLLLQGDSTGNEDFEFFYLVAQKLCQKYPTHTVFYRLWNPSTEQWESRTLQSGTGARTLRIYNGSVSGETSIYWQGRLKDRAYDGFTFDMVIVNYGLNTDGTKEAQTAAAASILYTLLKDQPTAEIIQMIQPPDYTDASFLARSQVRVDSQKMVADGFSVACVDSFSLFTQLVNKTGNVNDWYSDRIHPNAAGQAKWADLVFGAVLNTKGGQKNIGFENSQIPNANFSRWFAGFPVWWTTNATLTRETLNVESGQYAVRCNGIGAGTGTFTFNAQEFVRRMEQASQLVIYARVKTFGSTYKPGILFISRGSAGGGDYEEIRGNSNVGAIGSGNWRWAVLVVPKSFYYGKTGLTIGLFSGEAGEYVIVDRVIIGGQFLVPDSSGVDGYRAEYSFDDTAFSIPANSTVGRNIDGGSIRYGLKRGARLNVSTGFPVPDGAFIVASPTSDDTTRLAFTNTTGAAINIPAGNYLVTAS